MNRITHHIPTYNRGAQVQFNRELEQLLLYLASKNILMSNQDVLDNLTGMFSYMLVNLREKFHTKVSYHL